MIRNSNRVLSKGEYFIKAVKCLDTSEMIDRGMGALYKELGPVEARRFIAAIHEMPHEDSVKRHHLWQKYFDEKDFARRIMTAQRG